MCLKLPVLDVAPPFFLIDQRGLNLLLKLKRDNEAKFQVHKLNSKMCGNIGSTLFFYFCNF